MIGTRLGSYEITGQLGAGGMGEVYRATDTKLKRDVAIKVLPAAFTADKERLARFEREAQLLAQLHHPNIASIFGIEDAGAVRALVMELVEGPTLAERLERGALSIEESLAIAKQIAEALEAAHEKGIVHRDLKPQNIKASLDGKVKVLDFGLAKAMDPAGSGASGASGSQVAHSPTMTLGATEFGVILGTAAYMAPEQAKGLAVDKRGDIWAFGVVLHEMLTGERLFAGDTVPETLAAVIRGDIDLAKLPPDTPSAIRRLLRRCLERNPKSRLHDIADARIVLDDVSSGRADEPVSAVSGAVVAPARSPLVRALPWVAGLALGAAVTALVDRTVLERDPPAPPALVSLTHSGTDFSPTASPDGRSIAFSSGRDGRARIWLKQLATGEEVPLTTGPDDGSPVFSPDGSSLLFLRGQFPYDLYRVSAVGGEPRRIASGVAANGAWSPDGSRVATARSSSGFVPDILVTLAADGGDEREVARTPDRALLSLRWSPDGRWIGVGANLTTAPAAGQSILEFDAATGARRPFYQTAAGTFLYGWTWDGADAVILAESLTQSVRGGSRVLRVARGGKAARHLTSLRQPSFAVAIAGPGRLVIDQFAPTQNLGEWSIAPPGGVSSQSAPRQWLTRGHTVDRQPVFSPDGRRVAFNSDRGGDLDIWELELASRAVRRLTVSAADDWDPAYSPDGRMLLWSSNRGGTFQIWTAESDGSGARQLTTDAVGAENPTATPDGQWIVYASADPQARGVWKIRRDGSGAEPLVRGSCNLPELSPDGRWISFVDLDRGELRVVTLADGSAVATIPFSRVLRSPTTFGRSRWIPNSSTLVWIDDDPQTASGRFLAQEIVAGRDTTSTRRTLLAGAADLQPESFAISPDGATLLVSAFSSRSELLLVDGLVGVGR